MEKTRFSTLVVLLLASCWVAVPIISGGEQPELSVKMDVAPEASLQGIRCYIKNWNDKPSLFIELAVKNLSNESKRFNVKLKLADNNQTVAAFLPRKGKKGKPPVIQPGKTGKVKFPMFYNQIPKSFSLMIRPM